MTRFVLETSPNVFWARSWGLGEEGVHCLFMLRHYTACNPPFLLKSVELLSQPARMQTTTLRYNKGLRRRDEKDGLLFYMQNIFKET